MKVVHIITGLENGGAEAVLHRLVTHPFSAATNEHIVISLRDGGTYGPLLREAGIEVHEMGMTFAASGPWRLVQLVRLLRRLRPDVVQTWMYHANLLGGIAARLAGIGAVVWGIRHSTLDPAHDRRSTLFIAALCARLSTIVPKRIVFCATRARDVHIALGYDGARMTVIPNGYDNLRFRPDSLLRKQVRDELGLDDTVSLVGMIARYNAQKDHPTLVAALRKLREGGRTFHTVLVGAGITRDNEQMAELISGQEPHITLLGARRDIPALMNAMDIHVLSSSHGEAFPNVLSEAMACGTPCISTDVGDAAYIVGNTGWIVPPHSVEMLASAIDEALVLREQTSQWHKRQQAARDRVVENFDIETMVHSYEQLWQRVVGG